MFSLTVSNLTFSRDEISQGLPPPGVFPVCAFAFCVKNGPLYRTARIPSSAPRAPLAPLTPPRFWIAPRVWIRMLSDGPWLTAAQTCMIVIWMVYQLRNRHYLFVRTEMFPFLNICPNLFCCCCCCCFRCSVVCWFKWPLVDSPSIRTSEDRFPVGSLNFDSWFDDLWLVVKEGLLKVDCWNW